MNFLLLLGLCWGAEPPAVAATPGTHAASPSEGFFLSGVQRKINAAWALNIRSFPRFQIGKLPSYRTVIRLVLDSRGKVETVEVTAPSESSLVDRCLLDAVRSQAPYGSPVSLNGDGKFVLENFVFEIAMTGVPTPVVMELPAIPNAAPPPADVLPAVVTGKTSEPSTGGTPPEGPSTAPSTGITAPAAPPPTAPPAASSTASAAPTTAASSTGTGTPTTAAPPPAAPPTAPPAASSTASAAPTTAASSTASATPTTAPPSSNGAAAPPTVSSGTTAAPSTGAAATPTVASSPASSFGTANPSEASPDVPAGAAETAESGNAPAEPSTERSTDWKANWPVSHGTAPETAHPANGAAPEGSSTPSVSADGAAAPKTDAPAGPLVMEPRGDSMVVIDTRSRQVLTTLPLANMLGDLEMIRRLKEEKTRADVGRIVLGTGAATLFVSSLVNLGLDGPGQPKAKDYIVNCGNMANQESCFEEQLRLHQAKQVATRTFESHRAWTSVALLGGSGLCLLALPFSTWEYRENASSPTQFYDSADLKAKLNAYNLAHGGTATLEIGPGWLAVRGTLP